MTEQREESYSPTGRGLRSLVLASLLAGASGWCAAQDAGKATCRENGALRICADHVSLSGQEGRRLLVTADARITVNNTGKLPLSLFAVRSDAQFLPDQGPAIADGVKVFGLPMCTKSVADCAADRKLIPLTLPAGGSASIGVSVTAFMPKEEGPRLARAQKASLSWNVVMIDAEQRTSVVSLSLPASTLDNGLAGSR